MASRALSDAFESAKKDFLSHFPNGTPANFEEFTTIDDVYKAAEDIQSAQAKSRTTRNLRKIQPFLECLRHYGEVIETFVTVKPDILALIRGPIKFLLLTSSTYIQSFDKLVDTMAQVSLSLPAFEKYTELFPGSQPIHQVLCLFYQDILDFYATVLDFFKHKRWSVFFESLWPKSAGRIRVITENIEKHRILMDGSITLAHVLEAHVARQRAFEEFERQHDFRQRQDLEAVKFSLSPALYDRDLQHLKSHRVVRSGDWLLDQEEYTLWTNPSHKTSRLLWLQGIPGAGKTFLSSSIIENISTRGDPLVFAFLKYHSRESISALQLLHSFIWQIALDHKKLQSPLILAHQEDYRRLNSDLAFVQDLFSRFLDLMPTTFIVIDGLDEISQFERFQLLRIMFELLRKNNVKVLVSSRPEDDISRMIPEEIRPLRVHDRNKHDIEAYVHSRASSLVSDSGYSESGLAQEIPSLMKAISVKAEGMFLYARLVCDSIELLGDFDSIKEAVEDLPNGLNEAYDRILYRITDNLGERQSEDARQILALITCSVVPLSKNEIQLAVYTAQGRNPSRGCKGLFLNILQRCGPFIEEIDGHFRFVHFSARDLQSKQYLTEPASHARNIRSGAFVLLDYVCNHWLHHIERMGIQEYHKLLEDIESLIDTRSNSSFEDKTSSSEPQGVGFSESLGSIEEKTKRSLDNAHEFSMKRKRDLSFDDKSHSAQVHDQTQSRITQGRTKVSSKEELKDILTDAVKENDLFTIQGAEVEEPEIILSLLLSAYQEGSSDAVIHHLLRKIPPDFFQSHFSQSLGGGLRWTPLVDNIFKASIQHGNYEVFQASLGIFSFWTSRWQNAYYHKASIGAMIRLIGRTRRGDLVESVSSGLLENASLADSRWLILSLYEAIIPQEPDPLAEILALECFKAIQSHIFTFSPDILYEVSRRCCSIDIAKFLLANGANIDGEQGGWSSKKPIVVAARKSSREAARFIEFLVKEGASTPIWVKGKALSELTGPRNIQQWIGITWEELIENNAPSAQMMK
ncbi:hypothetical protein J7T55_004494 [Diaporthe amygdali]|uniref:uncharacterized protein n=1 Tax=Phomopsis amygdali TaxID=1214568 RepID=UPI0022FEF288|nr:uncharacterized protein J7T55_004494 [Diaporthe amygdali]KAJ0114753.1 hypothetical protein J7T55_004494 [Diaporthe amygdali]